MSARPAPEGEVTRLLEALHNGASDERAEADLFRRIYDELHALARQHRARWHGNETINTTALMHEAYLKLVGAGGNYENRAHFLAVASKAMRHVLVSYAEQQSALKRGGSQHDLSLEEALFVPEEQAEEVLALEEALQRLERVDDQAARIVECRFFGGLTNEETAAALEVSPSTVTRRWRVARAWLYSELKRDPLDSSARPAEP
ncbi:MAG: sigma-70 family RNA polymerase sigma factor [Rhodothermaceae bacterium]|nr:sigma-70 family RNA polymerase sigma factor [Rhodothermaceae bacterium]